jgi:hypothetical protein
VSVSAPALTASSLSRSLSAASIAAPGDDVKDGRGKIDAMNLRLTMRPEAVARIPQAANRAGTKPGGTARPLIGCIRGDSFHLETVDGATGIVPGDLLHSRIDDRRDSRNRQRRLGNVGGHDDPAARRRRSTKRSILRRRVQRPVKRDDLE